MRPVLVCALVVLVCNCAPRGAPGERVAAGTAPLHDVMREFAGRAGYTVVYESRALLGARAQRAVLTTDARQALRQMLAGTGLAFHVDDERRVIFLRDAPRTVLADGVRAAAELRSSSGGR